MGKLFQAPRLAWEDASKRLRLQVCYLTSLSSYLTILPLNTMNSNMFLTSNMNVLSSNTQTYEISGIPGKGGRDLCGSVIVRSRARGICLGRYNHTHCHPQVPATLKTVSLFIQLSKLGLHTEFHMHTSRAFEGFQSLSPHPVSGT